jgi:hypothetical protein
MDKIDKIKLLVKELKEAFRDVGCGCCWVDSYNEEAELLIDRLLALVEKD